MSSLSARLLADAIARKLATHTPVGDAAYQALLELPFRSRTITARQDIVSAGQKPETAAMLLAGIAGRYLETDEGQRQLMRFHFRGEWLDEAITLDTPTSHSIFALSDVVIALVSKDALPPLLAKHPQLALGFWKEAVIEGAMLRQANLNLGLRSKPAALAHLFCELYLRARFAGLCEKETCDIPLTQSEIASALGIALVTVNRTLKVVRETGAVEFRNGRLTVSDFSKLADYAGFDARYLHLPAK